MTTRASLPPRERTTTVFLRPGRRYLAMSSFCRSPLSRRPRSTVRPLTVTRIARRPGLPLVIRSQCSAAGTWRNVLTNAPRLPPRTLAMTGSHTVLLPATSVTVSSTVELLLWSFLVDRIVSLAVLPAANGGTGVVALTVWLTTTLFRPEPVSCTAISMYFLPVASVPVLARTQDGAVRSAGGGLATHVLAAVSVGSPASHAPLPLVSTQAVTVSSPTLVPVHVSVVLPVASVVLETAACGLTPVTTNTTFAPLIAAPPALVSVTVAVTVCGSPTVLVAVFGVRAIAGAGAALAFQCLVTVSVTSSGSQEPLSLLSRQALIVSSPGLVPV